MYDASSIECTRRLEQIFCIQDKRDDQFKVQTSYTVWNVCYHNSHCTTEYHALVPSGFTCVDIYLVRPRVYFLLQSVRPYVDDKVGSVLDIIKYRRFIPIEEYDLLRSIADQLGERFGDLVDLYMRDFIRDTKIVPSIDPVDLVTKSVIAGHHLPWHLLHYYDLPDRQLLLTEEEASILVLKESPRRVCG